MKFYKYITPLLMATIALSACGESKNNPEAITPVMGTIEKIVESTGLVVFDDDYIISSSVNAKVLSAKFEEGDTVLKGQVLYELDDKDIQNQISQTNISLEKAIEAHRHSINAVNDLKVKAFTSGMITKTYCNPGDFVSSGSRIADVVDSSNLILRVPFNALERENIHVGQPAKVIMNIDGSVINGEVIKVFDSPQTLEGRQFGVNVEISVSNPGALKQGDTAFALINETASAAEGTLKNKTEQFISATQSGQIAEMKIKEGANVNAGEVVMIIKNDSLQNAVNTAAVNVKDVKNLLSQLIDKLSDYRINAPIDGVIIKKYAKMADMATAGAPLAVIADNEKLCIEAEVDEIYIKDISAGQKVSAVIQGITGGEEYTGRVINVGDSGAAKNGVTYYKVKISLDLGDGLMEAMNMTVEITAASKDNAMIIPTGFLNGNKVKVLKGKKVVEKEVTTGIKNKQYTEIIGGLSVNDRLAEVKDK